MGFWFFMLCSNFMIPLLMVGFGCFFKKFGAGSINAVFGYRTSMSMKNQQTWDFANLYFARLWIKVGLIMLPISVLLMLPVISSTIPVPKCGTTVCPPFTIEDAVAISLNGVI